MYETLSYEMAKERVADLHREAEVRREIKRADERKRKEIEDVRVKHGFFWTILHPGKKTDESHNDSSSLVA